MKKTEEKLSPMMKQYLNMKEKYKDCILFFRLGDFYEMFFEDAELCARELELTLTGKDCGLEKRAPMCGVPHHACEGYIAKLLEKGYKVAICEQLTLPTKGIKVVERDVVRIITPGTLIESSMLDENKNNYIICIYKDKDNIHVMLDLDFREYLNKSNYKFPDEYVQLYKYVIDFCNKNNIDFIYRDLIKNMLE